MALQELTPDTARGLAHRAYTYGFAIVENYRALFGMSIATQSPQFSGFNRFLHGRELFDADYDLVVNANNDTLYSTAFADLRAEPLVIDIPPTGARYFTMQLVDMSTDNFAYLGTRTTGTEGCRVLLVGPRFRGALTDASFTRIIVSRSDFVGLATRTAISGPDDLAGVIAVQDALRLTPLSAHLGTEAPAPAPAVDFPPFSPSPHGSPRLLELLNVLLAFHVPALHEHKLLHDLSAIDVGAHRDFALANFPPEVAAAIGEGVAAAHAEIEARGNSLGETVDGWLDIPPMGDYGDDYLFRSAVAWKFIYTNSPEEALYPIAETDADGQPLSGEHRYELHFDGGRLPPVDAFWSVTLYDSASRLMVHNPIDRFSIGDRTAGLVYDDDGSLTILIQHDPPVETSNWLPAPVGRFYLNVRAYLPQPPLIDGSYRLPPVRRVG